VKRRVMLILLLLVLGAIVNVAVAWGFSIAGASVRQIRHRGFPSSPREFHIPWIDLQEGDRALLAGAGWRATIDDDRAIWIDISARRRFGLDLVAYLPHAETNIARGRYREDYRTVYRYGFIRRPGFGEVVRVFAGWPASTVADIQFHHASAPPQVITVDHASAVRVPELFGSFPSADGFALPTRILWPGFVINTLFYAVILWLLFAAPFVLRRRRRIKRGRCPKCAYDLRGRPSHADACPECGFTRRPQQSGDRFAGKLTRMQRILTMTVMLGGCAASTQPQIHLEGHPPRVYERPGYVEVLGWYSAKDLDTIVREYAQENSIKFAFAGTNASFAVPRDRDCLARATYSSGIGRPVLSATIGWDGHVASHSLAIAIDEIVSE
jgi:hypothetical protein